MDLTFGDFNFRATRVGILRLQDSTRSLATRTIEPKRIARWADDEDELGSEPDSPNPTHPHLHFVAMVKHAKKATTSDKSDKEADIDLAKVAKETETGTFGDGE